MWVSAASIENFRALRAIRIDLDARTMLIGESGAGCSSLMIAIERVLGAAPPDGGVRIDDRDFFALRSGERAEKLAITLALEPTPGLPTPRLLASALGPRASAPFKVRVNARREGGGRVAADVVVLGENGEERPLGDAGLDALRRCAPAFVMSRESYRDLLRDPADAVCLVPAPERDVPSRLLVEIRRIAALGSAATPADVATGLAVLRDAIALHHSQSRDPDAPAPRESGDLDGPIPIPTAETLDLFSDPEDPRAAALLVALGVLSEIARSRPIERDATPILLLDNVDAGLHPRSLASLASILRGLPGQRIVHSYAADLISWAPLESLRRIETVAGQATVHAARMNELSRVDARRIAHHVRRNRAETLLSRCWLLVEGETEAWLLPEFARLMGLDLRVEGVQCIEFAQAGLDAMIRLADMLGIKWIVFTDGDPAGDTYGRIVRALIGKRSMEEHLLRLPAPDVERFLYNSGFAPVYDKAAGRSVVERARRRDDPSLIVRAAIKARSKPDLAIAALEFANGRGADAVPPEIQAVIRRAVDFARRRGAEPTAADRPAHTRRRAAPKAQRRRRSRR